MLTKETEIRILEERLNYHSSCGHHIDQKIEYLNRQIDNEEKELQYMKNTLLHKIRDRKNRDIEVIEITKRLQELKRKNQDLPISSLEQNDFSIATD